MLSIKTSNSSFRDAGGRNQLLALLSKMIWEDSGQVIRLVRADAEVHLGAPAVQALWWWHNILVLVPMIKVKAIAALLCMLLCEVLCDLFLWKNIEVCCHFAVVVQIFGHNFWSFTFSFRPLFFCTDEVYAVLMVKNSIAPMICHF